MYEAKLMIVCDGFIFLTFSNKNTHKAEKAILTTVHNNDSNVDVRCYNCAGQME